MPQPTRGDVHVSSALTNLSIAFMQDMEDFIADKVFPTVPVSKQADTYYIYPKDQWHRTDARERAPASESAGSGFELQTDTYSALVKALHYDVADQIRDNSDSVINLDRDATEFVTQQLMLKREQDFAAEYFAGSQWTGSTTGSDITPATKWDAASSTPIEDLRAQMTSVRIKTGRKVNTAVLAHDVWDALVDHPDFLDRIKYVQRGIVAPELLASLLGLDRVFIASAINNTANEGATPTNAFIYSDQVLLAHVAPRPSILTPSAGYTFAWSGFRGSEGTGVRVKRFRMEHLEADRIEGQMAYDQKLVAADLGAFFTGVLT